MRAAREVRALPGRPAVQPHDRGARRRDLRGRERLAHLPALRADARHEGPAVDVQEADRRGDAPARLQPRHHDVQLAGERLPRCEHPRRSRNAGRSRVAGRQAGEPRLPPLAADRGAGWRPTGSARPSSGCGPTSWAPPTASRSIPTSARPGASALSGRSSNRTCPASSSTARGPPHFHDSVGVGWYPIDIHRSGPEDVGVSTRTRPFQIPLGALIPADARQSRRGREEHRDDAHHERLLPAAPGRVEHRRVGRRARGLVARTPAVAGADLARPGRVDALPATPARRRRSARLDRRRAGRAPAFTAVQASPWPEPRSRRTASSFAPDASLSAAEWRRGVATESPLRRGQTERKCCSRASLVDVAALPAPLGARRPPGRPVGVDSYAYHRLLGETRPGETPARPPLHAGIPRRRERGAARSRSISRCWRRASSASRRASSRARTSPSRRPRPRPLVGGAGGFAFGDRPEALAGLLAWLPHAAELGLPGDEDRGGRPGPPRARVGAGRRPAAGGVRRGTRPRPAAGTREPRRSSSDASWSCSSSRSGTTFASASTPRTPFGSATTSRRRRGVSPTSIEVVHLKDCERRLGRPGGRPALGAARRGRDPARRRAGRVPATRSRASSSASCRPAPDEQLLVRAYVEYLRSR